MRGQGSDLLISPHLRAHCKFHDLRSSEAGLPQGGVKASKPGTRIFDRLGAAVIVTMMVLGTVICESSINRKVKELTSTADKEVGGLRGAHVPGSQQGYYTK